MAGGYLFKNHASSTLDGGITDSATSMSVQAGEGALFPASNFKINIGTEVILVGTRTTDSFSSCTRGWDGTTAAAHSDNDVVLNVATAEDFATIPRDSRHDAIYRRPSDETAHAKDDEFDGLSSVTWSEYAVSGSATWNEDSDQSCLTCLFASQTANDAAIRTQPMDGLTAPVTIESRIYQDQHAGNYSMTGLVFTNGETTGSGCVMTMPYVHTTGVQLDLRAGTLTNISSTFAKRLWLSTPYLWWRLIWVTTNSWKLMWSQDYSLWYDGGANAFTLAPTRFGLWVTTWGGATSRYSSFDYFRVYESDLSA